MISPHLQGRTILLVEDEYFQARDIKDALERRGATVVGPTGRAEDVPELLEGGTIDAALLDINLGAGPDFATADYLRQEGVPFAFLTGYDEGSIPSGLGRVPRLQKPANERMLVTLLAELLDGGPAESGARTQGPSGLA
ncbi:response regulator [Tsuneonella sp. HG249]